MQVLSKLYYNVLECLACLEESKHALMDDGNEPIIQELILKINGVTEYTSDLADKIGERDKKDDFINTMTLRVGEEAQIIQSGWDEIKVTEIYPGVEKNPYENGYTPDTVDIQYFRKDEYESALRKHHQYLDWKKIEKARAELEKKYNYDGKHGG